MTKFFGNSGPVAVDAFRLMTSVERRKQIQSYAGLFAAFSNPSTYLHNPQEAEIVRDLIQVLYDAENNFLDTLVRPDFRDNFEGEMLELFGADGLKRILNDSSYLY